MFITCYLFDLLFSNSLRGHYCNKVKVSLIKIVNCVTVYSIASFFKQRFHTAFLDLRAIPNCIFICHKAIRDKNIGKIRVCVEKFSLLSINGPATEINT